MILENIIKQASNMLKNKNVISHELKYSFANPSSPYKPARKSRISMDESREIFAEILNCSENEIKEQKNFLLSFLFTS